jgi:sugar/nucleoside kinase (ribokinase family)
MKYDFVAVGDIVTDAFIRLKEADVECDEHHEHCTLSMPFGDKIPYENVWIIPAVGNPANAAVAASRLGLKSALVSDVGDDNPGKECLAALAANAVSAEFIRTHAGMKTNYHYVLWAEDDRTILIKHEEYPYEIRDMDSPRWIYFSSLAGHSLPFHEAIADWLDAHPDTKLAFQPNTYQIRFGTENLRRIYARTEIFFCNKEEAQRILSTGEEDEKKLMAKIAALGPKIVIVTDGPKGAYVYRDGKAWFMRAYPDPKPPYERTGAGDAFSSTVTAALALGAPLEEALRWGPVNAMAVVQEVGAQKGLLSREKLEAYLRTAPKDYELKAI